MARVRPEPHAGARMRVVFDTNVIISTCIGVASPGFAAWLGDTKRNGDAIVCRRLCRSCHAC